MWMMRTDQQLSTLSTLMAHQRALLLCVRVMDVTSLSCLIPSDASCHGSAHGCQRVSKINWMSHPGSKCSKMLLTGAWNTNVCDSGIRLSYKHGVTDFICMNVVKQRWKKLIPSIFNTCTNYESLRQKLHFWIWLRLFSLWSVLSIHSFCFD